MPYALSNLVDGRVPSARYVPDASHAVPGEAVVSDADYRDGWVWDAANRKLRPRADAEILAEAKARKKNELEARAAREMETVLPVYQALLRLGKNLLASDPKWTQLSGLEDKRARGASSVDAKATPAEVDAVTWEAS